MEKEIARAVIATLIGFLFGALACLLSASGTFHDIQKEAISRGFAEHDAKTGKWHWKEKTQ